MSGPQTRVDRIPYLSQNGSDLIVSAGPGNLGEQVRLWIEGEAFPRIILDIPTGNILAGGGAQAPFPAGGQITYLHPPSGVVGTDRPMLTQAIGDTPANGLIVLADGGDTPYAIDVPWVINKNLRIEGAGIITPVQPGSFEGPFAAPFLTGPKILQTAPGVDGIQISGPAEISVRLANIGVLFDAPGTIGFANTGHGINCISALKSSTWQDVWSFGHDGNHYGHRFSNPLLNQFFGLRAVGGGGIALESINNNQPGNCYFINPFVSICCNGTAHGIACYAQSDLYGVGLCTWLRPQVNANDFHTFAAYGFPAAPTAPQWCWNDLAGAGNPFSWNVHDIDLEPLFNGMGEGQFGNDTWLDGHYLAVGNLINVAVGNFQTKAGVAGTAVGHASQALDQNASALGNGANASVFCATALGGLTSATAPGAFALGVDSGFNGAASAVANQGVVGTANHKVLFPGQVGFYGHAAVPQAAHPVVLADVIAILANLGFCA